MDLLKQIVQKEVPHTSSQGGYSPKQKGADRPLPHQLIYFLKTMQQTTLALDPSELEAMSCQYGAHLEYLSINQRYALLSLIGSTICSPDCLPTDLVALVERLTPDQKLALIEGTIAQLTNRIPT